MFSSSQHESNRKRLSMATGRWLHWSEGLCGVILGCHQLDPLGFVVAF